MRMTKGKSSKGFKIYLDYTKGIPDPYLGTFRSLSRRFLIRRVLYPGSYCHLTPSLIFNDVVYVDNFPKTRIVFEDERVLAYIKKRRRYKEEPKITFHLSDYVKPFGERERSLDLLISLNAGFISTVCGKYLRKGGILLVNDGHGDASRAFVGDEYRLIGVFSKLPGHPAGHHSRDHDGGARGNTLRFSDRGIGEYFQTTSGKELTLKMVEEILHKSPSKLSYRFKKEAGLYVFKRTK